MDDFMSVSGYQDGNYIDLPLRSFVAQRWLNSKFGLANSLSVSDRHNHHSFYIHQLHRFGGHSLNSADNYVMKYYFHGGVYYFPPDHPLLVEKYGTIDARYEQIVVVVGVTIEIIYAIYTHEYHGTYKQLLVSSCHMPRRATISVGDALAIRMAECVAKADRLYRVHRDELSTWRWDGSLPETSPRFSWQFQRDRIVALLMAMTLGLGYPPPAYVVLWILEYFPAACFVKEKRRAEAISRAHESISRVLRSRTHQPTKEHRALLTE